MKKLAIGLIAAFFLFIGLTASAAPITPVTGGGTGTSTVPTNGYLLIGNGTGYTFIASSSLGGGGSSTIYVAGSGITSTASGATTTFILNLGAGCSGNQFVATISPTGTISCATPSGGASSTNVFGTNGVSVSQSGVNATASLDTTYSATWTGLELFNRGLTAHSTTTLASNTILSSLTNTYIGVNASSQIIAETAPLTSVGGNNTDIQYNNNGVLGGSDDFTFDGTNWVVQSLSKVCFGTSCSSVDGYIWDNGGLRIIVPSADLNIQAGNTVNAGLNTTLLSTNREFKFPDKAGTFALTSDLPSFPLSYGSTTHTTFSTTTAANTFTFSVANGNATLTIPAAGSTLYAPSTTIPTNNNQLTNGAGYITGNQTITFTASGDATGTASGATSINDSLTVTGLRGKALPALATGSLYYTGGAWNLGVLPAAQGGTATTTALGSCAFLNSCGSGGGSGTVTTSSAVSVNEFPYWTSGSALAGTSTIFYATSSGDISIGTSSDVGTLNVTAQPGTGTILNIASSSGIQYLTVDSAGALNAYQQVQFTGPTYGQFQDTTAGASLDFKTVAGNGDITFTPNATRLLTLSHSGIVEATGTFLVDHTSTFLGNISTTIALAPFLGTNASGIIISVSTSTLKTYTDTFGYATSTSGGTGTVTTSTTPASGTLPIWTNNTSALGNSLISQTASSTVFVNASTTNFAGTISEAGATTTNCLVGILDPTPCVTSFNTLSGAVTYIVTSTNPFISITNNNTSSALTFSSSSLNLGSISTFASTDYLTSSTNLAPSTTIPTTYVKSITLTATTSDYSVSNVAAGVSSIFYLPSSTWMKPGNNLSELTNTSTARTNLGLGSAATHATTDFLQVANNLSDLNNTSTSRTNLGFNATSALALAAGNGSQSSYGGSTTSGGGNCLTSVTISATGTLSNTNGACSGGGGGGGVATTTTFSAGFLPVTSSSLAITNSVIFQNTSTKDISVGTTTDNGLLSVANNNCAGGTTTFSVGSSTNADYPLTVYMNCTGNSLNATSAIIMTLSSSSILDTYFGGQSLSYLGGYFAQTTSTIISNTAVSSTMMNATGASGTSTILGGVLSAGSTIEITAGGTLKTNSSAPTVDVWLGLGGTYVESNSTAATASIATRPFLMNCTITIQGTGSSAPWVGTCLLTAWATSISNANQWALNGGGTINTNNPVTIDAQFHFSAASTNNVLTVTNFNVRVKP